MAGNTTNKQWWPENSLFFTGGSRDPKNNWWHTRSSLVAQGFFSDNSTTALGAESTIVSPNSAAEFDRGLCVPIGAAPLVGSRSIPEVAVCIWGGLLTDQLESKQKKLAKQIGTILRFTNPSSHIHTNINIKPKHKRPQKKVCCEGRSEERSSTSNQSDPASSSREDT